jgi:hypothetical protein
VSEIPFLKILFFLLGTEAHWRLFMLQAGLVTFGLCSRVTPWETDFLKEKSS